MSLRVAQVLFDNGVRSVEALSSEIPENIARYILLSISFDTEVDRVLRFLRALRGSHRCLLLQESSKMGDVTARDTCRWESIVSEARRLVKSARYHDKFHASCHVKL